MLHVIGTQIDFDKALSENASKLVIVDFTAAWCGPCERIAPLVFQLSVKYKECFFIQVDVDDNPETSASCEIDIMPTFQFYKNGSKVDELIGSNTEALEEKIIGLK